MRCPRPVAKCAFVRAVFELESRYSIRQNETDSMSDQTQSIRITADNPKLADLKKSWVTAAFTAEDGMGPMASLHQAGDSIVALAMMADEGMTVVGSGVMIGPGLILTASHVLEEFPAKGTGPLCLTFLPGAARAWVARGWTTTSRPNAFDPDRRSVSDLTMMSCGLNSDAHEQFPLALAPIQLALPLIGERLWAFGYRHGDIVDGAALLTPLATSGVVTACFPQGRGERMPSSCIEVAMDTIGGMSGGPVVNDEGWLVGIVSSSFEDGPTYVTLMWDAMRLSVNGAPQSVWPEDEADLFLGRDLGLVLIKGSAKRDDGGNVVITLSTPEMEQLAEFSDPVHVTRRASDGQI
jgi:S1-C subfamily serine protease